MPPRSDLSTLLDLLLEAEVEFILVGGLAAVVQGVPISTMDMDIVQRRTAENIERLHALVQKLHARHRGHPRGVNLLASQEAFMGPGHQLLQTDLGCLDVLGSIEEGLTYDDLISRCNVLRLRDREVHVLSLEEIARLKSMSPRPKDSFVVLMIQEVLAARGHGS